MNAADPRVIVARLSRHAERRFGLAAGLDPALCAVKVGKELFTVAEAEPGARSSMRRGFRVFLDLKFHDIRIPWRRPARRRRGWASG